MGIEIRLPTELLLKVLQEVHKFNDGSATATTFRLALVSKAWNRAATVKLWEHPIIDHANIAAFVSGLLTSIYNECRRGTYESEVLDRASALIKIEACRKYILGKRNSHGMVEDFINLNGLEVAGAKNQLLVERGLGNASLIKRLTIPSWDPLIELLHLIAAYLLRLKE